MKLLRIDTTGQKLSVIFAGQSRTNNDTRRHSEVLNEVVGDWVHQCDGFDIVTGGEGASWTGSRVGIVAVKAWALATCKPIFVDGVQVSMHELAPNYDAEFIVGKKK